MGGILKVLSIEDAAIAAIRAGTDLIEICHSPELILRAYEALIAEAERKITFRGLLIRKPIEAPVSGRGCSPVGLLRRSPILNLKRCVREARLGESNQ